MTETEWFTGTDLGSMVRFVQGKVSERKMRLFACACSRQVWHLLEERTWRALEVAERYADGEASLPNLERAALAARAAYASAAQAVDSVPAYNVGLEAACLAAVSVESAVAPAGDIGEIANTAADTAAMAASWTHAKVRGRGAAGERARVASLEQGRAAESAEQRQLLRDIAGNPFRVSGESPSWQAGQIISLAQAIYEQRSFDRLPILADALEEAGCTDEAILSHCRGPGPHVRGCWVVDLVLGKE